MNELDSSIRIISAWHIMENEGIHVKLKQLLLDELWSDLNQEIDTELDIQITIGI